MVAQRDPSAVPFTFIDRDEQLTELSSAIEASTRTAVDTETYNGVTFFDGGWASLRIVSVATKDAAGEYAAFVVDFRDVSAPALAAALGRIGTPADAWNANFDDRVLRLAGAPVKEWNDAMYADGVLHSGVPGFGMQPAGENGSSKGDDFGYWHPLSWAAKRYLGVEMSGKGTTQTSYDGHSDLSDEQKRYPAHDALITLWVAEEIDKLVAEAGLTTAVANEMHGRPFILSMMENGFHFDAESWDTEVIQTRMAEQAAALKEMADLTGGSEMTLFGDTDRPTWDVNSDGPTRAALNKWATDAVKAFTGGSLLGITHRVDKDTLKQIDHPLAAALLAYRASSKTVTTYGENLNKFRDENGRVHAEYVQGGLVATGRLASRKPNAQNLDPDMKAYMRPVSTGDEKRVIVLADLSQAEVRVLAQLAQEPNLIDLFKQGGDFHTLNAGKMFQVDMEELRSFDPARFAQYRTTTKGTSFGIPYGLGAFQLAQNLTVNMKVPTTRAEAAEHIKAYLTANPQVDAWLRERDDFIKDLAANPPEVDWQASLDLLEVWTKADARRKSFRAMRKRPPSMRELSEEVMPEHELRDRLATQLGREPAEADIEAERLRQEAELTWALNFSAPVVLLPDGQPLAWESRTPTGRRRLFMIPMDRVSKGAKGKTEGVLTSFALAVATTDKAAGAAMRDEFAARHRLNLPKGIDRCPQLRGEDNKSYRKRLRDFQYNERTEVTKAFEGGNRHLKHELLKFLVERMGLAAVAQFLLVPALGDQIGAVRNQYRNHPIQGLVADIMLEAMGDLHRGLAQFDRAYPVQQVHDSIAIECNVKDAPAIRDMLKETMEASLAKWCPNVPSKADAGVCWSMSEKHHSISDDELAKLVSA